jgi:hypothetical protein
MSKHLNLATGRALHAAHELGQHDTTTAAPLPPPEQGCCVLCRVRIVGPGRIAKSSGRLIGKICDECGDAQIRSGE